MSGSASYPDLRRIARSHFDTARGSHDWDHTRRVLALCERIGPAEGADMAVLRPAALLHDIGRSDQDRSSGAVCHAERGAEMARRIVRAIPLSDPRRENIIHAIRAHRFRGNPRPETVEAKVLFDADKLDAIGAIGVARAYLFAGEIGARLHSPDVDVAASAPYSKDDTGYREYVVKLRGIRDRMLTPTGRTLAESRHAFMESFFERFLSEYGGRM